MGINCSQSLPVCYLIGSAHDVHDIVWCVCCRHLQHGSVTTLGNVCKDDWSRTNQDANVNSV
jgi:hypothetical protein